jgi:polysaccharide export outer membrane protein
MKKRYQLFILLLLMITGFAACIDTKKSTYFNGAADTSFIQAPGANENIIQNNDILSIAISSLNADASAVFNTANNFVISSSSASGMNSQSIGYLVNAEGNIQLPILGNVRAAGLTKEELKKSITSVIVEKKPQF